jgi:Ca2+-binding RTX toxin-like protein
LINVSASPNTAINVNAGTGVGDLLLFDGAFLTFALTATDFTTATREPVVYEGVETLGLTDGVFQATGSIIADVVVNSNGTLSGVGTVLGALTVNADGTVAPGVNGPASLQVSNTVFSTGGTYQVELNGLTPGLLHDQLQVTGTIDLGGATLDGTLGFASVPGDEIVIIRNDGSDPVVGKFAGGDLTTLGGKPFAVDYAFDGDGDGQFNDVALLRYGAELAPDPCNDGPPSGKGHADKMALFVSGTTGDDIIRFIPAPGFRQIRVLINDEDQGTFKPTGLLVGFGQTGNDTISVELSWRDAWLYGQGGDDTLLTRNGNSILLGGLGNDHLISGNGKNILIGGAGADVLAAGNGSDLLIAGSTVFDSNTAANREALCDIQDEWQHGWGCYSGRVKHLRFGGGKNGTTLLNELTVLDDASVDQLFGGNSHDWFLLNHDGSGVLDISDRKANETATDI